jgi:hypothetical protein
MSRNLIAFFFTYVITRLFYGLSGFVPTTALPKWPGYAVDLGIWLLVSTIVFWFLKVLGIGRTKGGKERFPPR